MTLFICFKNLTEYNKNRHYLDVCKIVYSNDVLHLLITVNDVQSVIYDITGRFTVFTSSDTGFEINNYDVHALQLKEGE